MPAKARSHTPTECQPARWRWPAFLIAAAILLAALFLFVDDAAARWAQAYQRNVFGQMAADVVSPLGRNHTYWLAVIVLGVGGWLTKRRQWVRAAGLAALGFFVIGVACHVTKVLVHRVRPRALDGHGLVFNWTHADGYAYNGDFHSFPSGDVTVSTVLVTICILVAFQGRWRWALTAIPLMVCFARMARWAHYPSDCLGGLLLGGLGAYGLCWWWARRIERQREREREADDDATASLSPEEHAR